MKNPQVIIGNSAAGYHAMQSIRGADSSCSITSISAEKCPAYSPVLLTGFLKKKWAKKNLFIANRRFYHFVRVKTLWGNRAVKIDPRQQTVLLENGEKVVYENLLIAAGASAIELPGAKEAADQIFSLKKIEDAEKIGEKLRSAKKIVVIGGGLIGLQVLDALYHREAQFILMEQADQVLPEMIDALGARIVQTEMEKHGVTVLLGSKAKELKKVGRKVSVLLNAGGELTADMVVLGIGQKPNIHILADSGIRTNVGILVDDQMRTSVQNVFAAGDITEGKNLTTGRKDVLPNWPNACHQGKTAGLNMAGRDEKYEGLHEAVTSIFGISVASIGWTKRGIIQDCKEWPFYSEEAKSYRKVIMAGKRIIGAILVGKLQDAGILKHFIRSRIEMDITGEEIARFPITVKQHLRSKTIH